MTVVSWGYDPNSGEPGVEEEEVLFARGMRGEMVMHGEKVMRGEEVMRGEPRRIGALLLSYILFC